MSERWFAHDSYPEIRGALAEEYQDLAPEQIEEFFAHLGAEADVVEEFLSDLGRGASRAMPYAAQALPGMIQGAASGAPLGVPGMIAGAALGGLTSRSRPLPPGRAPATPAPAAGAIAADTAPLAISPAPGANGSSSAAQLLLLLSNPDTMRALMALALGPAGRQTLSIGGRSVPVAEVASMLSVLSGAAAAPSEPASQATENWEEFTPSAVDAEARSRADYVAELLHQEALDGFVTSALPETWELSEALYEEYDEPYYQAVHA